MSNRRATVPKRASEIVGEFERRISTGRLQPGGRVPTVRALSDELGVAPATVASAYRQLAERGTLVSRGRLGTFVAARPALGAATPTAVPDGVVDLASGSPDPNLLPRLARRAPDRPVLYGAPQVHPALAHTAAEWLRRNRLSHGHLAVVGGAMDGVERLLQTYLRPGDAVAVEDPGYPNVVDIARGLGLAPVPVPVDGAGVSVDALRAVLRRVQAVVLTPRALNPTGAHLTPARARLLHEALAAYPEVLVSRTTMPARSPACRSTASGTVWPAGPWCTRWPRAWGLTFAWPWWPETRAPWSGCRPGSGWAPAG